jgi:hypothetical protein
MAMWCPSVEQDLKDLSAEFQKSFEPELLKSPMMRRAPMKWDMTPPRKMTDMFSGSPMMSTLSFHMECPAFSDFPEWDIPLTPLGRMTGVASALPMTHLDQPSLQSTPPMRRGNERPCDKSSCALMKCLHASKYSSDHGVKELKKCLAADPEAIHQFFFDCDFEPVLCFAVRSCCAPEVIELLLKHGADVGAYDTSGYSPLTCLAALPPREASGFQSEAGYGVPLHDVLSQALNDANNTEEMGVIRDRKEVARLLIQAGARPHGQDSRLRSPVEVATASGNTDLATFLEHYLDVEAGQMLVRKQAQSGPSPLGGLSEDELNIVLEHLLPLELLEQVRTQDSKTGRTQMGC